MGQAIAVRTDYTAGEVRVLAKRVKDAAQARRLLAIAAVSRELQALGHTVRLMPPAYVKPYDVPRVALILWRTPLLPVVESNATNWPFSQRSVALCCSR